MAAPYLYFEDVNLGLLRLWGDRRGMDVLDVGCGFATTSARIQTLGNRVTGIENSPTAVPVAAARLERVLPVDLMDFGAVGRELGEARFDVVVLADVLEHLPDPGLALEGYLKWLKPCGTVIVSLPNVGLWSVRLGLLFGQWNYTETGVLDRTHLRFFTWKTARALLWSKGIHPVGSNFTPGLARPFIPLVKRLLFRRQGDSVHDPAAMLNSGTYKWYLRMVQPAERLVAGLWPRGLAFQMIFEGKVDQA